MGLFKKKKKFPAYPRGPSMPEMPRYESEMPRYESQVDMKGLEPEEDHEVRIPTFPAVREKPPRTQENVPGFEIPKRMPSKLELRMPEPRFEEEPPWKPQPTQTFGQQPIYVKLEDYKQAIKNLSAIKRKVSEVEGILRELMDLKREEDTQLSDWQKEVNEIKNKLMEVDAGLFEVTR